MRWVKQHENEGKVKGYERKPKAYKVHKEHVDFLLQEIKKNKTITIDDLLYLLKNKYPDAQLSQSHLHRIIRDNNITLKLTRIRHEPVKRFGKDIDTPHDEFLDDDGISHMIEGGLSLHISYEKTDTNQCRLRAHIE